MGNQILKINNVKKTVNYLRKNGLRHAVYAAKERIEEERKSDYYYREPSQEILEEQQKESVEYSELFSIIVPAYETKEEFLCQMIDSVRRQSYAKWELIIVDAGGSDIVKKAVEKVAQQSNDCRIKYRRLTENKGISDNTNAGIALAAGDYIALLDHDDFLAPDALYHMAVKIHQTGEQGIRPALVYTDEDKYDNSSSYYTYPHRKTDFNLDLILSNNYICHFMAVEAKLMKELQLRGEYDGAQDYDLVLRIVDALCKKVSKQELSEWIVHVPRVLYHWRCHADSTAENTSSKAYAYEAGKAALMDFCGRQGWSVKVRHGLHLGFYEIDYLPDLITVREDVGLVGGRILNAKGRICGGAMKEDGRCMYEGLHKEYSGGSTHRAALKQDVAAVDIRCVQVAPGLRREFEQITGLPYEEKTIRCKTETGRREVRIADVSGVICDEAGYRKLSLELSITAANNGYHVLWDPQITVTE